MKASILTLTATTLMAAFTGCTTQSSKNAQNSTGLLEFIADETGHSGKAVPVEIAPHNSGRIAVARARIYGNRKDVLVSGSASPAMGEWTRDHVDVAVIGPDKQVLRIAVTKFTHPGSGRRRGGLPRSRYAVSLPGIPPEGSLVRVSYHAGSIYECPNHRS